MELTHPVPADKWNLWNRVVLAVVFVWLIITVATNAIVDPYYVFRLVPLGKGYTPNERNAKLEYLLAHPRSHDAFLIGSSRMGVYNPAQASALRPGRHYYNLSVFGGDAVDSLVMLKTLKAQGVTIREVVMGVDPGTFLHPRSAADPSYRHHPVVTGEPRWRFLVDHLLVSSFYHSISKLEHFALETTSTPVLNFDFTTGQWQLVGRERRIRADPAGYRHEVFGSRPIPQAHPVRWLEPRFEEFRALVSWLHANHVEVYFFLHPLNWRERKALEPSALDEFVRRIEGIAGPVKNYLGKPEWRDDKHFYDPKHYRPYVAEALLRQLWLDPSTRPVQATTRRKTIG